MTQFGYNTKLLYWNKNVRKKQWRRNDWQSREDKDHDLWYGPGPPAKFRWVCGTGVGSNSTFCNGCKHWVHKKCIGLKRLIKDPDYRCTWCTPFARQTTEGSPSWTWQAGGGSFFLLPRRHALCSQWLWTFKHNMCENPLEEVQGAATSSLFPTPLFQDMWLHVQCRVQCFMPMRLGHWQSLKCLQQNERAMIRQFCNVKPKDIVTIRSNEILAQLGIEELDLILKERRLCWYGHCFFVVVFYLGFTALSRIFHLNWADQSSKVGEIRKTWGKPPDHSSAELGFPTCDPSEARTTAVRNLKD